MTIEIDDDGYPVDPKHPFNQPVKDRKRRRLAEGLARCERARANGSGAVVDALKLLAMYCGMPSWIVADVEMRLTNAERRRRREDAIHYMRWDAVVELRVRRRELFAVWGDRRGLTWERAYEAVAALFKGRLAAGEPSAVKASYLLVARAFKKGRGAQ